jgi:hypothetical protein
MYVVAENKGIGAREAIKRSKTMMDGHKMDYFVLGLSRSLYYQVNKTIYPDVTDWQTFLSNNNAQVEYIISPIVISLTPQQIAAIKGDNTISANTNGKVTITYTESIKHYLDKQDN